MSEEARLREAMCEHGRSLYRRGLAHGSSGNISARVGDAMLITPTNSCLGRLDPARIALVAADGGHRGGDRPSKEAFLHLAMYRQRATARGIVHLHSTHAVAVSCLCHADPANVLPPITAYYAMRVGRLPLVPYFRPGDPALAAAVEVEAGRHRAVLLANHGPVVAGATLDDAVCNAEELEETAKLFLMLRGAATQFLTGAEVADIERHFPS